LSVSDIHFGLTDCSQASRDSRIASGGKRRLALAPFARKAAEDLEFAVQAA
jgi:hypothetical protein